MLATLFRCIKLAENAGFGFDKMRDSWFAYNQTVPEFRGDIDFSVVEFKTTTKTTTKKQDELLDLIRSNPSSTLEIYAQELNQKFLWLISRP